MRSNTTRVCKLVGDLISPFEEGSTSQCNEARVRVAGFC
jgi:hypothetical protein